MDLCAIGEDVSNVPRHAVKFPGAVERQHGMNSSMSLSTTTSTTSNERLAAAIAHGGTCVAWFVAPLVVYLIERDRSSFASRGRRSRRCCGRSSGRSSAWQRAASPSQSSWAFTSSRQCGSSRGTTTSTRWSPSSRASCNASDPPRRADRERPLPLDGAGADRRTAAHRRRALRGGLGPRRLLPRVRARHCGIGNLAAIASVAAMIAGMVARHATQRSQRRGLATRSG